MFVVLRLQSGLLRMSNVESVKSSGPGGGITVRIARDKLRDAAVGTGGLLQLDLSEYPDAMSSNPMTLGVRVFL